PLPEATRVMVWLGIRHLPVVDSEGKVVGVVSERDLAVQQATLGAAASETPVRTIMSRPVQFIHPTDTVTEAAGRMAHDKIGCLPVVEKGRLVGILSATDLLMWQFQQGIGRAEGPAGPKIRAIMTRDPETVQAGDSLTNAILRMQTLGVRHLPVVDEEDRLVGILSDRDIRMAVGDPGEALEHALESRLHDTLRVGEVMRKNVLTTRPDAPVREVAHGLSEWGIGAVPVVDEENRVVGIVSYTDLLRALATRAG
ncbi:MAG: CBS domain-containing protein, partial [Deltaproteobacteria bacterium]